MKYGLLSRMGECAGMHSCWPSWGAWEKKLDGMGYLSRIILCIRVMGRCQLAIHG